MINLDFIIGLIVSIIAQFLKRFGYEKWATHIAVFILALIASMIKWGIKWMPEIYWQSTLEIWASSVALYELILKRIEPFRKLSGQE